jgi:predicted SnoaL-like aldol condensation-catalyzing enzyme
MKTATNLKTLSRGTVPLATAALALALGSICTPGIAIPAAPCPAAPGQTTRAEFRDFLDLLLVRKDPRHAFERFAASDLIQHDPAFGTTRDSTIEQWTKTQADPASHFEMLSTLVDGQFGAVRFHGVMHAGERGATVAQFLRFSCGRIVEIWDVFQAD